MLSEHLPSLLENVDLATRQWMWVQLDDVEPHYARIVREFLNNMYLQRWIGRAGPVSWPARAPAMTSLDFFLWGFIKDKVYKEPPTTREDMKNWIREACVAIPRHILLKPVDNFQTRMNLCLEANGANFEQLFSAWH